MEESNEILLLNQNSIESRPKPDLEEESKLVKNKIHKQKKIRKLEDKLNKILLDPIDTAIRRRYIKKWIYGEGIKLK